MIIQRLYIKLNNITNNIDMDFFTNLFKPPPTIDERVKEMIKTLNQEMRNIDRQIKKIDIEERKVKIEAKKAAKQNKMDGVKILAKSMVHSRKASLKLFRTKSHINSVITQLNIQLSQIKIAKTIQKSTQIMKIMNSLCKVPQIASVMQNMSKEMMKMNLIEETINDQMDEIFDDVEENEVDDEVNKVIDEILIGVKNTQLPTNQLIVEENYQEPEKINNENDTELEKKLDSLKYA